MIAVLTTNGGTVTHGDGAATTLLVATIRGMLVFERAYAGAPWNLTRKTLEDRHVSALLYVPKAGLLFAGAHGQGSLVVSKDLGLTWQPADNGLNSTHIYTMTQQ